jgi:hypothetical protein
MPLPSSCVRGLPGGLPPSGVRGGMACVPPNPHFDLTSKELQLPGIFLGEHCGLVWCSENTATLTARSLLCPVGASDGHTRSGP